MGVELAPGIRAIGGRAGGRVHAFVIGEGNDLTLIDTLYETTDGCLRGDLRLP
jgi:hypothetical protein